MFDLPSPSAMVSKAWNALSYAVSANGFELGITSQLAGMVVGAAERAIGGAVQGAIGQGLTGFLIRGFNVAYVQGLAAQYPVVSNTGVPFGHIGQPQTL